MKVWVKGGVQGGIDDRAKDGVHGGVQGGVQVGVQGWGSGRVYESELSHHMAPKVLTSSVVQMRAVETM